MRTYCGIHFDCGIRSQRLYLLTKVNLGQRKDRSQLTVEGAVLLSNLHGSESWQSQRRSQIEIDKYISFLLFEMND